jgi:hypothetical protein
VSDTSKKTGDGVDTVVEVPVKAEKPAGRTTARSTGKDDQATLHIRTDLGDHTTHSGDDKHGGACRPGTDELHVRSGGKPVTLTYDGHKGVFVGHIDLDDDDRTAFVDVAADPFTCSSSCRTFRPEVGETTLQVTRGCTSNLTIAYAPGLSSIQVTPRFRESSGGKGHVEAQDVPGVRFDLFVGGPDGGAVPRTRVTSVVNPSVSFTDIPPGRAALVVTPPTRFGDRAIELRDAGSATKVFEVEAGQNLVLDKQYQFRPAAGDVTVTVVADVADGNRLPGIPVRLSRVDNGTSGNPDIEFTGDDGVATFSAVPAGTYRVELAVDPVPVDGRTWTTNGAVRAVVVTAEDSRGGVELRLAEDVHLIRGTVFGQDGKPAAFVLVEIRTTPEAAQPFDTTLTNAAGQYEWSAPNAGQFFVTVPRQDGQAVQVLPVVVNSVVVQDVFLTNGSGGSTGATSTTTTTNDDPTPFPLLVGNVDLTTGTAPQGRGGGGGYGSGHLDSSAGATVSAAIRDVLGYRTKTADSKGFVTALQRSFSCHDKSGYTVCTWTPLSYAATIPADLGALTGAQASIFERAKVSADSIIPLLDGLTPLASIADREDVDSIRSIVRSRVVEIVNELSLEGGPRTQRVDELFERLTGLVLDNDTENVDFFVVADSVAGELGVLRQRFGFLRDQINLIAEEEDFTNFLIIVDSIGSLFITWQQVRGLFRRDAGQLAGNADAPFLGTQLVLLSRQLGVITETVRETYFAMDSVFLGAAERQTVLLPLIDEGGLGTSILLSELLDWIDRFVTEEGPRLVEDSGTDGVNALEPTIRRLSKLTTSAATLTPGAGTATIPPTFFTGRVQLALRQLAGQLVTATTLADAVFERLNLGDPPDVDPDPVPGKGMKYGSKFGTTRRGGRR